MNMGNYSTYTVISSSLSGSSLPISLTEAKQWLRVDTNTDDNFINRLITASLQVIEIDYGFPVVPQILEKKYATNWAITLAPFSITSLISVTSGSNNYTTDAKLDDRNLIFSVLPTANEVVVRYNTGETKVPEDTIFTMLKYIVDGYESRTSEIPSQMNKSINAYDNMVSKRKFFYI